MAPKQFNVVVDADVQEFFTATIVNGKGGFQTLCRMLADRLRTTRLLKLTPDEFARIVRYANSYGNGGFQSRLRAIIVNWVHQNIHTVTKGD